MPVTVLWVGDSFTAGEGAVGPAASTYPHVISDRLGWTCHVDAQNGTGFVNDGFLASPGYAPLIARLPDDVRRWTPDIVIIDAGRNDAYAPTTAVRRAVEEYLAAVRAAYPEARVILVAPSLVDVEQPPEYRRVTAVLREVAPAYRADVIDPSAAGIFRDPVRNRALVCDDGFHPSDAGQAYYAEILTRLLREAVG